MKHTECKDCKLRNGDCGHHFKMNGKTNYDIPSLSACDRYGECMFFQQKEKPQGDLISREALKKEFKEAYAGITFSLIECNDLIDNAPTVTPDKIQAIMSDYLVCRCEPQRPQGEYVDISKLRLMTVEECAGHTIDYAMGWKACIEWIKKGGEEK